jgi:F0F1-type ATP synthase membrane subunit c/vacuolar-type H+-ATPase subunit K
MRLVHDASLGNRPGGCDAAREVARRPCGHRAGSLLTGLAFFSLFFFFSFLFSFLFFFSFF